jgi:hypothetical protein
MNYRIVFIAFIALMAAMTFSLAPASAETRTIDQGGTYMWTSVEVPADEEVHGDITVVGGDADVYGRVDGDVTVIGGTLTREDGSVITGTVNQIGGNVSSYVPFAPGNALAERARRDTHRLMVWLAGSVMVFLAFVLFPVRVRGALDRVEHHPGLSAGVGVLALVAVVPVAFLLLVSIVGIPLVPVELIAVFAMVMIGQAALSTLVGRRIYELVLPHTTPAPLGALILGIVVIGAAGMVPVVGPLFMGLVWLVGLGAAILAFVRETTFMHPGVSAGGNAGPRPPISGPPMASA